MRKVPDVVAIEEMNLRAQRIIRRKIILFVVIISVTISALGIHSVFNSELWQDFKKEHNGLDCEVHFFDSNYGDYTFVECNEETALIDFGNAGNGEEMIAYLHSKNIEKIEYFFATGVKEEYIDSFERFFDEFDVGRIILPSYIEEESVLNNKIDDCAFKNGVSVVYANVGLSLNLDKAYFSILTDDSVSLKFKFGNHIFLFLDETDEKIELDLMESNTYLDTDVLRIRGQRLPCDEFLEIVTPEICVVSCDEDSVPDMFRLQKNVNKIYRTDTCGNIVITSDEVNLDISYENQ